MCLSITNIYKITVERESSKELIEMHVIAVSFNDAINILKMKGIEEGDLSWKIVKFELIIENVITKGNSK